MDIKWFFKGTNAFFTFMVLFGIPAMVLLIAVGSTPVVTATTTALSAVILAVRRILEVTR